MIRSLPLISAISLVVTLMTTVAKAEVSNQQLAYDAGTQTIQIADLIDEVFHDFSKEDILTIKRIADCESGGQQKGGPNGLITHLDQNGSLITNRSSGAVGAMQILKTAHSRSFWARQTLDETKIRDNLVYARALIEERLRLSQSMFADWNASRSCWQADARYVYNSP